MELDWVRVEGRTVLEPVRPGGGRDLVPLSETLTSGLRSQSGSVLRSKVECLCYFFV